MKISTRGKNAIKIMLDLAVYNHGEPVKVKDIAARQNISEKYLEQIIAALHKATLVKSIRGAHGGYILSYKTGEYTVGRILKAVEGNMSSADCVGENGIQCDSKSTCVSYRLWEKLDTAMNEVLEGVTLEDMLEWQDGLLTDQYVI
ncbi:MAG: Rrf2 family transcriptional regulator [Lachnospiraceae bacterium]|nr:Rrf2 family transcriptional regulator [Lachnospiraceae bacterium]